jgi:hypothetical protein
VQDYTEEERQGLHGEDGEPTGAYTINPDTVAMGLALCSLYLISDAEAQAIAYHDGMYIPEGCSGA